MISSIGNLQLLHCWSQQCIILQSSHSGREWRCGKWEKGSTVIAYLRTSFYINLANNFQSREDMQLLHLLKNLCFCQLRQFMLSKTKFYSVIEIKRADSILFSLLTLLLLQYLLYNWVCFGMFLKLVQLISYFYDGCFGGCYFPQKMLLLILKFVYESFKYMKFQLTWKSPKGLRSGRGVAFFYIFQYERLYVESESSQFVRQNQIFQMRVCKEFYMIYKVYKYCCRFLLYEFWYEFWQSRLINNSSNIVISLLKNLTLVILSLYISIRKSYILLSIFLMSYYFWGMTSFYNVFQSNSQLLVVL
eukprot:TRINITY_DN29475_c0_g2_i6.p1 TRINITY_DN29475_c0_g2~~TRINITY_DN29475_c0_g2_i6.p1  ORF type:complete len:304 (-),score=-29.13 TRINITY_DN29475_c0_g2_i6:64-975(-)